MSVVDGSMNSSGYIYRKTENENWDVGSEKEFSYRSSNPFQIFLWVLASDVRW